MILDILNKIEATSSTNEKLAILKENAGDELLKTVYRLAYHPRLQYGIKKIPDFETDMGLYQLAEALDFLENHLATRKCTGNNAINRIAQILAGLQKQDAEVLIRVIKRDLKCGASSTLANKVWKNIIPKQPQMLASSYSAEALANIKFPALAQLKADGARCFAEIRGDELDDVIMLSRGGNEYLHLNQIKHELIKITKAYREIHGGCMVDGELVYLSNPAKTNKPTALEDVFALGESESRPEGDNANQKAVVLRSESNGIANKSLKGTISQQESAYMSFQVWDLVPLKVIYDGEKSVEYTKRFDELESIAAGSKRILSIESVLVNNVEEARAIYKKYVEEGLEGIILKNTFGLWENKRSKNQVKFKEEIMIDLRVYAVQVHSKDPTKLGAIFCRSDDGLIKVKCGSGFTDTNAIKEKGEWIDIPIQERDDLNRSKLWLNQDTSVIDAIVELKCNGWTSAEGRKGYVSLFLPVIERFRIDKDETNTLADVFPDAVKFLESL